MTIKQLTDTATRNQVFLEGLKAKSVQDFNTVFDRIDKLTQDTLAALGVDKLSDMQRAQFEGMLDQLRDAHLALLDDSIDHSLEHMAEVAKFETEFEAKSLKSVMTPEGRQQVQDSPPGKAYQEALARPVQATGELLEPLVRDFADRAVATINNKVRTGYDQGRTTQQIIRDVVGTPNLKNKDGVTDLTRRQAATVVRTSIQHVANTARQVTWEENKDLVQGVVWVSTLDSRTTSQCRSLDHRHFKLDEGPRPPIHPNCRSTTAPDLDPAFDFLDAGATRSSAQGYVDQNLSYYDWLHTQREDFQDEVLGKTRGKLFRDGGLTTEDFANLQLDKQFKPITLDRMREIEPLAFQRAGLSQQLTLDDISNPLTNSVGLPGRPKPGSTNATVWDLADSFQNTQGRTPTRQDLLTLGRSSGITDTAITEHYRAWRVATEKARGMVPPPVDATKDNKAITEAAKAVVAPPPAPKTNAEKWTDIKTAIDKAVNIRPATATSGHAVDQENLDHLTKELNKFYALAGDASGTINLAKLSAEQSFNLRNYLDAFKELSGVDFTIAQHSIPDTRLAIHKLLETVNEPTKHLPVTATPKLSAQNLQRANDAQDFLSRIVADKYKQPLGLDKAKGAVSAFYRRSELSYFVSKDTPTKVHVHEMAHHIEYEAGKTLLDKLKTFLDTRQGTETRFQHTKAKGYKDCLVFEDEFIKRGGTRYTSRVYYDKQGNLRATEVLSTGAERLYFDPVNFYNLDPEHFEITVKALLDIL